MKRKFENNDINNKKKSFLPKLVIVTILLCICLFLIFAGLGDYQKLTYIMEAREFLQVAYWAADSFVAAAKDNLNHNFDEYGYAKERSIYDVSIEPFLLISFYDGFIYKEIPCLEFDDLRVAGKDLMHCFCSLDYNVKGTGIYIEEYFQKAQTAMENYAEALDKMEMALEKGKKAVAKGNMN